MLFITLILLLLHCDASELECSNKIIVDGFIEQWSNLQRVYGWDSSKDICSLEGVYCEDKVVVELDLSYMELGDSIPAIMSCLTDLRVIRMNRCSIRGNINEIPFSTSLQVIDLSHNRLTGNIKELDFWEFPNLWFLDLSKNNLRGSIPEITIPALEVLNLSYNKISGSIPASLLSEKLLRLHLGNNSIEGNFPQIPVHNTSLVDINVSMNLLTGSLPTNISNLKRLERLYVDSNNFKGSFPVDILTMENLIELNNSFEACPLDHPNFAVSNSLNLCSMGGNKFDCVCDRSKEIDICDFEACSSSVKISVMWPILAVIILSSLIAKD